MFSGLIALPASAQQFLNFPVSGLNAYSSNIITSVLDHEVPHDLTQSSLPFNSYTTSGPHGYSNGILSFTGELFTTTASYPPAQGACYPKSNNPNQPLAWRTVLQGVYTGTGSGTSAPTLCTKNVALNYDNHPGYDYKITAGTDVVPAYAAGSSSFIIFSKCIVTFSNSTASNICDQWGAVAVDHGNGYVTQYLHMTNLNYGVAASGSNQPVTASYVLGKVGGVAPGGVPTHLHFEVLRRRSVTVDPNNYYSRKNYYIVDPYGYNTASYYADNLLSKPGCLWAMGCSY